MTKKFVSMLLALAMCLTLSAPVLAVEEEPAANSTSDSVLTFEEYLEKYGEENVKAGFAAAEAEAMGGEQALSAQNADDPQNEGKSLFECLSEGEFLGLKVLGVTDIAPGEPGFMVCVEKAPGLSEAPEADAESTIMPMNVEHYTNYDLYYSTVKPDNPNIYYEPLAGSYFKKQSFAWDGLYQCNTTVTFNGTELYCGTQANNAYIYLCAKSSAAVIDFGLMASPKANDRNRGLYAFYNASTEEKMWVEGFPKVQATSYGNNYMRLENKTVTIQLSTNRNTETVTMYMSSGGSMIFHTQKVMSGMSGNAMTFQQAMSYVSAEKDANDKSTPTQMNSGSYFRNVKFSDTVVFSETTGKKNLLTVGPDTFFTMVCEPSHISYVFNDSSNTQTVSINY